MIKFVKSQFSDWQLLVKYIVSGSIAATTQILVLAFLVEFFNMWHIKAVIIAFFISSCVAFLLQKFWTFRDVSMDKAHFQMTSYLLLMLVALFLNVLLMYIFVDIMGLWYILAQLLTMGLVVIVVFLTNKYIIFNRESIIFGREKSNGSI